MSRPLHGLTRRGFAVGLAATAASAMGCSRRRPANVLRVAFSPPRQSDLFERIAAAFRKENPGLDIELMPSATYDTLMQRDFRLALVEDEPDVSHIGMNHVGSYVERDLATPLEGFLEGESRASVTAHPTMGRVNGSLFGLPFAVSIPVSYFNLSLFRRCGVREQSLLEGDWDVIVQAASAVSRQRGRGSGIFFDCDTESALAWQMLLFGRGGRLVSEDGSRIAFNDEAGLWCARRLAAFGRAGQMDFSRENARMAFLAGMLGCYHNTSANFMRFASSRDSFEMGMAVLPVLPGTGRLPAAGNLAVMTTRDPARQELAWKYIRFATGALAQAVMASTTGYLTLNPQALEEGQLRSFMEAQPMYRSLYDGLGLLVPWAAFPGPRSKQISDRIRDGMRELVLGRIAPKAGLESMSEQAQRLLERK